MSDDARVRRVLDGLGVPYEIVEIDPAFADTAAFCEKYGYCLDVSGNNIIVASKKEPKQYAACLVLANTRLDVNHAVKRLMGASRVSFASADETMALTGMQIGGVTVLALPPDLPVYVDDRIMALDWMILGAGSRSAKVKISPRALERLPGVQVVPGLAQGIGQALWEEAAFDENGQLLSSTLMDLPWIILGGGSRSLKIKVSPDVFRKLPGATVVAGLSNSI